MKSQGSGKPSAIQPVLSSKISGNLLARDGLPDHYTFQTSLKIEELQNTSNV